MRVTGFRTPQDLRTLILGFFFIASDDRGAESLRLRYLAAGHGVCFARIVLGLDAGECRGQCLTEHVERTEVLIDCECHSKAFLMRSQLVPCSASK